MGMFDYVRCDVPLPDGYDMVGKRGAFQTKDFDCDMTEIVITADGRLQILRSEWEPTPKAERPYPDDEGWLGVSGSMQRVNERWVTLDFHGDMNFYDTETIGHEPHDERGYARPIWIDHDYVARFTDGRLVSIRMSDEPGTAADDTQVGTKASAEVNQKGTPA